MKTFMAFVLFVGALFFTTTLTAQVRLSTQPYVQSIVPDNDVVHVITGRVDVNFDGMQDEGDVPAKWYIVDVASQEVRSEYEFGWADVKASRVGLDKQRGLLFVGIGDSVFAFTSRTQTISSTPVFEGINTAVSFHRGTQKLFISQRPGFTDPGTLVRIDVNTLETSTVSVNVNPQQTLVPEEISAENVSITVCEGVFGQNNGSLDIVVGENIQSIILGDTPNHAVGEFLKGRVFVAINGSHQIKVVDIVENRVVDSIMLPTEGFNGPREIALSDGFMFVTSYDSKVFVIDRNSFQIVGTIDLPAKADPIAVVQAFLWVGLSLESEGFGTESDVLIYPLSVVSVAEEMVSRKAPRAILVTSQTATVPAAALSVDVVVTDLHGNRVNANVVDTSTGTINVASLANGTYVVVTDGTTTLLCIAR